MIPVNVLCCYGWEEKDIEIAPFGTGLINHTWKIRKGDEQFILQQINQSVFKHPADIDLNIKLLADHLKKNYPEYLFASPVPAANGTTLVSMEEGYFRLFPFVPGSHSIDVVTTAGQAYEAARQFGRFTRLLKGVDVGLLKITIPHFHDLSLRYRQFTEALENGNPLRIREAGDVILLAKKHVDVVTIFEKVKEDRECYLRVTHHDTKISNVLFDEAGKGLCVIDLDTVMPGYFISDVGDMMRTYLSPVSEEESDFRKIEIRESFYKAIVAGYYEEMKEELSETEQQLFFYAGKFMIYMQALRFLTDHLNNDQYYGAGYPGHNLIRAQNQFVLLEKLVEQESALTEG